ncbi:MAG: hypothetical protein R3A79_31205 [Nannocystaceae bacterium]
MDRLFAWGCGVALMLVACGGVVPGETESSGSSTTSPEGELDLPGFVIDGAKGSDRAVAYPCGDVNGDGLEDLVVNLSEPSSETIDPEEAGVVGVVVYGKVDHEPIELAEVEAGMGGGRAIIAPSAGCSYAFVGLGDVDGDGFDDLAASYAMAGVDKTACGGASVILGGPMGTDAIELVAAAAGEGGFALPEPINVYDDNLAVARIGDLNGDGFDDLGLVNSTWYMGADELFIAFGGDSIVPPTFEALSLGEGGRALDSPLGPVDAVRGGDINGDGIDDLVIAHGGSPGNISQEVRVIFGSAELATVEPTGFTLQVADGLEVDVAAGGDIDGDGLDDLVISDGSRHDGLGGTYVVFGDAERTDMLLPDELPGAGFIIAAPPVESGGVRRLLAPDLSGNGRAEIAIGHDLSGEPGEAWIVFGKGDGETIALDPLVDSAGYRLSARSEGEYLGRLVGWAAIGGDPRDLIIADPDAAPNGPGSGRTYVFFKALAP